MELKKITFDNVWKIVHLGVSDSQQDFVATNGQSIIEAFAARENGFVAMPYGIYESNEPVGFVMFGFDTTEDEDEPAVAKGNYCLWRFMIDQRYQGKGLGTKALQTALDFVRSFPCGKAEYCWLSYEKENVVAKKLYNKFGFVENGEFCDDEIVAVLKL